MNKFSRWMMSGLGMVLVSLSGCGGGSGGCGGGAVGALGSVLCDAVKPNEQPVAAIAIPAGVTVNSLATLDGSNSRDPEGQSLKYTWELTARPVGSQAELGEVRSAKPTLLPDKAGAYAVRLVVNDGKSDSAPVTATVSATRVNKAPVASPGEDIMAIRGREVVLNGINSFDPDGDVITYQWDFATRPAGSTVKLEGQKTARPFFTPDVNGNYVLSLVASDGTLSSPPVFVTVTAASENVPPNPTVATPPSVVLVGTRVVLDASNSMGFNGNLLRYEWTLESRPMESRSELGYARTARPEIVPDFPGDYAVGLVVHDGPVSSAKRVVTLRVARAPSPTATASAGQSALVNQPIVLDANGSALPGGAINSSLLGGFRYRWALVSPANVSTTIPSDTSARTSYTPTTAGTYVFRLTVIDADNNQSSSIVAVQVGQNNARPESRIGYNQNVEVGRPVVLDGTLSTDRDAGTRLAYSWELMAVPPTSTAGVVKLSPGTTDGKKSISDVVTFVPDKAGTYVIGLVVNDGIEPSAMTVATVVARDANQKAPEVKRIIQSPVAATPGGLVELTSDVEDLDTPKNLLTYTWEVVSIPLDTILDLRPADRTMPNLYLRTPRAGEYVLRLQVSDGVQMSPWFTTIVRVAAPTGATGG